MPSPLSHTEDRISEAKPTSFISPLPQDAGCRFSQLPPFNFKVSQAEHLVPSPSEKVRRSSRCCVSKADDWFPVERGTFTRNQIIS
ncbi:hypothetical protein AVEN_50685-1 [Araneus ventricosus]|uniref:Uncharacterized protein n=1 Tax=Araneus ventricosus TaxID=182803 RepID=A0A4Y2M227_ARAVE|nr:hypothetical protein AVEN_50685-1 [Araneus ventricosus]